MVRYNGVPKHIRHAVSFPHKHEQGFKCTCKCGWTFWSPSQITCDRMGTQHLHENTDENGDS